MNRADVGVRPGPGFGRAPVGRAVELDLSIIIPVYNERENLVPLLEEIEKALAPLGRSFEVIVVDDGSRDGGAELVRELVGRKRYLRAVFFRFNCGQTAAFDAGFRRAAGRLVVTMDADLQNDPRDIPRLIAALEAGGYDFVTGWRRRRQDNLWIRTIPSWVANALVRRVTGTRIHDLGCSLKVYRREITDELRLYGEMHRFISVLVAGAGARVGEIEVSHRPRRAGRSKYGLTRTAKVLLDLLTVWFMQRYQTKPIYIFGGVGLLTLLTSGVIYAVVLFEKFVEHVYVHRNPKFLIAMMFTLMGVQFLVLGLIAEIMVRTYFESQDKTAYVVAGTAGFDEE